MLRLNPGYKAPDDYKPILKETKIPLPVCAHNTAWCLFFCIWNFIIGLSLIYKKLLIFLFLCHDSLYTLLFRCRSTGFIIPIWGYLSFPMLCSRIMYHHLNCLWEQMCCLFIQFICNKLLVLPVKVILFLKGLTNLCSGFEHLPSAVGYFRVKHIQGIVLLEFF
jgi:hypothetical protein